MEFRILGPLEVVSSESSPRIGGGKRRALLAFLLLRPNEVVSVDALIDALWGAAAPSAPRTALHVLVSTLRKELGEDAAGRLETHYGGYALRVEALELDSERFAHAVAEARAALEDGRADRAEAILREALDLWRGPPLQEFTYDDFAQPAIARLVEQQADAQEELIDAELALGRHVEAIPTLEQLVQEHPDRERRRAQLVLALYRARRQSDALAAYQDARSHLVTALGVEPGPGLRTLQQQILNHDPALEPAVPRPPGARMRRRGPLVATAVAAVVVATGIAAIVQLTRGAARESPISLSPLSVAAVDPAVDRIVADVPLLPTPRATPLEATDLAAGFGSVWVTDAGAQVVLRIDARSRRLVRTIGIGADVRAVATGFGSVWVADGNSAAVTRVDPRTDRVSATIPLGADGWSYAIATGAGDVWAVAGSRLVVRIDPRTNRVVERIHVANVISLAAAGRSAFCGTPRGIERIRLRGGRSSASSFARTGRPVQRLQVAGAALWGVVQGPQFEVWRYDTRDGGLRSTIEVGQVALGLAATRDAVFVPLFREGELITIAPTRNIITHRLVLRPRASLAATAGGLVWVLFG